MSEQLEIFNAGDHGNLRLRPTFSQARNFVQVVPAEFAFVATICPIFFAKNRENGRFYAGAMFGFKDGENLLGDTSGAGAGYVPLDLQREAFFIAGEGIAIDRSSSRFSESQGEPLFDDDGEPTQLTRQLQRILGQFKAGLDESELFLAAMTRHGLIEAVDIALRFDDGETIELQGLYSISLDKIGQLGDAAVLELFRSGFLQFAYCVAGSLKQVPILANERNRRLAQGL